MRPHPILMQRALCEEDLPELVAERGHKYAVHPDHKSVLQIDGLLAEFLVGRYPIYLGNSSSPK